MNNQQPQNNYVILLHGLGRSKLSMKIAELYLASKGYEVINIDYPSRTDTIEDIAINHVQKIIEEQCTDKSKKINFVTHSLGGILTRHYLQHHRPENLGRVVMLAPPNKGSEMANLFSQSKIVTSIMGSSLKRLKTDSDSIPNTLPAPDYEVGIIAGKFDFTVPPEMTKLEKSKDFTTVNTSHTFIMNYPSTLSAILKFLQTGKF